MHCLEFCHKPAFDSQSTLSHFLSTLVNVLFACLATTFLLQVVHNLRKALRFSQGSDHPNRLLEHFFKSIHRSVFFLICFTGRKQNLFQLEWLSKLTLLLYPVYRLLIPRRVYFWTRRLTWIHTEVFGAFWRNSLKTFLSFIDSSLAAGVGVWAWTRGSTFDTLLRALLHQALLE